MKRRIWQHLHLRAVQVSVGSNVAKILGQTPDIDRIDTMGGIE
jgi:hypothetical protein